MSDFSPAQVEQLIQIAEMNSQVGWIIGDEDVLTFYTKLKEKYSGAISAQSLETLEQMLPVDEQPVNDDEIPF